MKSQNTNYPSTGSGSRAESRDKSQTKGGFGLTEIIIVSAIITTALFGFSQTGILSVKTLRSEKEKLEAILLAQEALETVRSLRDESWTSNITPLVNGTSYYPIVENNKWKLTTVSPGLINGIYDRYVILSDVLRDASDKISGAGVLDPGTKMVIARVVWPARTMELQTYITNFQATLPRPQDSKIVFFEDATTDASLGNFPSMSAGDGDLAQSFTTPASQIEVTRIELYLKRAASTPSNIYVEIRTTTTGAILGTSNVINSATITNSAPSWVTFYFDNPIVLNPSLIYFIRLRSVPSSTDAGSGSAGLIHWNHKSTPPSPYSGGQAVINIGRLSDTSNSGVVQATYDFGFRVYDLQ